MKYKIKFIYIAAYMLLTFTSYSNDKVEHKIAVLVNEQLITSYDIIQRMKLSAILQGIDINEQNNQLLINNTVDELIQEKLKIEKIKEYKVKIEDEEYLEDEINFFKRNNLNKSEIMDLLELNNIEYSELKNLLINEVSWNKLINGLFLRLTSASEMEVEEILSKNPNLTESMAENFVLQRQLELKSSKMLRDMLNEATIEYK